MTLPSPKPAALTQGEQLTRDLNRAAQNSLTTGAPYGFGMSKTGYGIYAYREELWDLAGEVTWDAGLTPDLTLENVPVKLRDTLAPMVVFEPTGMNAPFSVMLSGEDARFEIISSGAGAITFEPRP